MIGVETTGGRPSVDILTSPSINDDGVVNWTLQILDENSIMHKWIRVCHSKTGLIQEIDLPGCQCLIRVDQ